jgi:hypothetical protein
MLVGFLLLLGALEGAQAAAVPAKPVLSSRPAAVTKEPAAETKQLYRLDVAGSMTVWAQDRPTQSGSMVVFHRYPDGVLVSLRRADVARIVVARYETPATHSMKPGGVVDLGVTGSGAPSRSVAGGLAAPASQGPGERKDGTALFNPNRAYRPDWDSKQVPGMSIGNPNSANDYLEGKTFAYPAPAATQAAPGDLPRAAVETGDPKSPQ